MDDKFSNLRQATRGCIEQLGSSRDEELFAFRNAATFSIIHDLLREYDHMVEVTALPVATHSLGTLTAAEMALVQAHRQVDQDGKTMIRIAVDVASKSNEERQARARCEVVDLASARLPKGIDKR